MYLRETLKLLKRDIMNIQSKLHPDLLAIDREIDAFHAKTKHHQYLPRKDADILAKLSKQRDAIWRNVAVRY
jgi:hypothetical protein